jgi:hypothetical protein
VDAASLTMFFQTAEPLSAASFADDVGAGHRDVGVSQGNG